MPRLIRNWYGTEWLWNLLFLLLWVVCILGLTEHTLTYFGVWFVNKRCCASSKEDHLLVSLQGTGEDPWWHCWLHSSWHLCDWHPGGSPRGEGMAGDPEAIPAGNHQYQLQSGEGLFQLLHVTQAYEESTCCANKIEREISGILPTPPLLPSLYYHCIWMRESELNLSVDSMRSYPGAG